MLVKSINAGGTLLSFDLPKVMGILNVTPDSFYNNGKGSSQETIIATAQKMLEHGAEILDIGGQSTRPNAKMVGAQEEMDRVLPIIEKLKIEFPKSTISIDTFIASVAHAAVLAGATIVNDVSGGELDNEMFETVAKNKAVYICMHMQGVPANMQDAPTYDYVVNDVYQNLQAKLVNCRKAGIKDIILDVGFGFGKTMEQNYALLNNLALFQELQCPLLAGLSRKSMIYKLLNCSAEEALNGTSIVNTLALTNGANILRVHDVKEAMECVKIYQTTHSS
jgi:dihydropteroate synthase